MRGRGAVSGQIVGQVILQDVGIQAGDLGDDALRETGHRELKSRTSRLVMVIRIDQ